MSCNLSDSTLGPVWFTAMKTDGVYYYEPDPPSPLFFDSIASLGSGFDPVTSVFTAPVPGIYFFTATLIQTAAPTTFYLMFNGAQYSMRRAEIGPGTTYNTATVNSIVKLAAGDTMHVQLEVGSGVSCYLCNFDGYLLRRQM